jgi:hypothetical protein
MQRESLGVVREIIKDHQIIFITRNTEYRRSPHITVDKIKNMRRWIEVEIRGRVGGASGQSCGGEQRRKGGEGRRWRWLPAGHGGGGAQ